MFILLALANFALWTVSFSLGKLGLESSSPVFLTACRMGLAGIILFSYVFLKRPWEIKLAKFSILPLIIFSLLSMYLTNICEFRGLQFVSPAKACFIYSLSPFFAIILSYIHFREKITWQKIVGLFIAIGAILPILQNQDQSEFF